MIFKLSSSKGVVIEPPGSTFRNPHCFDKESLFFFSAYKYVLRMMIKPQIRFIIFSLPDHGLETKGVVKLLLELDDLLVAVDEVLAGLGQQFL